MVRNAPYRPNDPSIRSTVLVRVATFGVDVSEPPLYRSLAPTVA
jgi:hypothetical protein